MSLSETTVPSDSKSKPSGAGTWTTSCRSGFVSMVMSSSAPAMLLTMAEWGPATLTTTGDAISVPSSSFTPRMRPASA